MLPSPSSSPRRPLANHTNTHRNKRTPTSASVKLSSFFLPTPKTENVLKRKRASDVDDVSKTSGKAREVEDEEEESSSGSDDEMEDLVDFQARTRRRTVFRMREGAAMARPRFFSGQAPVSTRPILQSFVSSHKSDLYRCHSIRPDGCLTPPYACAYTNGAKRGESPLLAVATEQGTVHILDTSKRPHWECEPQRTSFQTHANGIFDIKWSPSDNLLATASGDYSTRISSPSNSHSSDDRTLYTLLGHGNTVKCIAWTGERAFGSGGDRDDILATGARDGSICIWDLRASSSNSTASEESRAVDGDVLAPMTRVGKSHGPVAKPKGKGGKSGGPSVRSVTSLVWSEGDEWGLISSGSFDGILQYWDIRYPTLPTKSTTMSHVNSSPRDPTTSPTSQTTSSPFLPPAPRRSRGIISLTSGTGPTSNILFALSMGGDARIHTYSTPSLEPIQIHNPRTGGQSGGWYAYANMHATNFYVRTAVSPCGRWLASGSSSRLGKVFLFDVSSASSALSPSSRSHSSRAGYGSGVGVELSFTHSHPSSNPLPTQMRGEVGALDWAADGMLATCVDDGTVRVWRPDLEVHKRCVEYEGEERWNWCWAVPT
ncbi:hypothetical protein JAAARDRAFT_28403 [Jaapia argillacea MUCL 33604]|uniref:Uncharacterized protein n=1 Tax=Jaapia argillacea MUCL 33604 TaxID=933084 RepID=A0A067QCQ8_9AGAM|nr:hypothetical protein JAAARDRAFT_28403 [Jaapia argillacea MUCL 33604]